MLLSRITITSVLLVLGILGTPASLLAADLTSPETIATAALATATASVGSIESEVEFCAEETNRYRASIGLGPLARSADLEDFANRAAVHDSGARVPHQHFALTKGAGVSRAETEVLWWSGFSVRGVVARGLAKMWEAGPGGHHYEIMAGAFSEIGCGISVKGGEITVTQDFR